MVDVFQDLAEVISFYTPSHVSDGLLCYTVGRPCVRPYLLFPTSNLSIVLKDILQFGISIGIGEWSIQQCASKYLRIPTTLTPGFGSNGIIFMKVVIYLFIYSYNFYGG